MILIILLATYFLTLCSGIFATVLDGTTTPIFVSSSNTFIDGEYARGFVKINNGFSIAADATAAFNIFAPISGSINLNTTGTMKLEGDVHFDSNTRLISGGNIDARGNAIFLDGNFTIPENQVLTCVSNTVIDGQGHQLVLQNGTVGGKILINGSGAALTLRNLTLRGLRNYADGSSGIGFGLGSNQSLVLENVTIQLADDYLFDGGKLMISGKVTLQGSGFFYYQAPHDLTIFGDATLCIDMGMAFLYIPSDKSNAHLVLRTSTSKLFLNGCTFFVPSNTGLQLTKGNLIIDHKVDVQSDAIATTDRGAYLFGDGNQKNDLSIDIMPGAQLQVDTALLVYKNKN